MLKIFAVVLLATSMSAGSVYARVYGGIPMGRAHFPTCPAGLVKAMGVCRAADGSSMSPTVSKRPILPHLRRGLQGAGSRICEPTPQHLAVACCANSSVTLFG
jgi:hypothetical protein